MNIINVHHVIRWFIRSLKKWDNVTLAEYCAHNSTPINLPFKGETGPQQHQELVKSSIKGE